MKTYVVKDEEAVAKLTVDYLKKIQEQPEKYMPMCSLCSTERSYILMAYEPPGEKRTALFGVCKKCCPDPDGIDKETINKIMAKVKERMGTGESTVHITPKNWIC
jgi:hypothetical protein